MWNIRVEFMPRRSTSAQAWEIASFPSIFYLFHRVSKSGAERKSNDESFYDSSQWNDSTHSLPFQVLWSVMQCTRYQTRSPSSRSTVTYLSIETATSRHIDGQVPRSPKTSPLSFVRSQTFPRLLVFNASIIYQNVIEPQHHSPTTAFSSKFRKKFTGEWLMLVEQYVSDKSLPALNEWTNGRPLHISFTLSSDRTRYKRSGGKYPGIMESSDWLSVGEIKNDVSSP